MFDLDLWREIFQSISKNKTRGLLSAFTVAFAIMLFTILFGIANGLENTFAKLFVQTADNSIIIQTGKTSKPYKGLQIGRNIILDNEDYDFLKNNYREEIEFISPKLSRTFELNYKDKKGSFQVLSINPDYQFIEKISLVEGRFISAKDVQTKAKYIVIGKLIEEEFFYNTTAIGKYLNLEGIQYKIIGVFTDNGGDNQERIIYMPITTTQQVYLVSNNIGEINLTFNREMTDDEALSFGNKITKELKKHYDVSPDDQRAIRVTNMALATKGINTMTAGLSALVFIIGLGTLIAGIVGISNIMIFIVKERTKEIGIRKALGAQPKSIVSIILIESVLITTIAGYIGLLIGVGVLKWVGPSLEPYFITNPSVSTSIVFTATVALIMAGGIAGFFPAKRASRIKPIVALRNG